MWSITRLDVDSVSPYEGMTYPLYRKDLKKFPPGVLAMGASFLGQPVGLALASLAPGMKEATLLSLMVAGSSRDKGLGTALLKRLEEELASLEAEKVSVIYTSRAAGIPAFERVLAKQEWSEPKPRLDVCRAYPGRVLEAPWLSEAVLPEGFEIFSWGDLTNTERWALLKAKEEDDWLEKGLMPFQNEEQIEEETSLGLRHQGKIAGWVITHRTSLDTLRYSALYVFPRFQKMARALPLLAEAVRRQVAMGIAYSDWLVSPKNLAMQNFVQRRMKPYLLSESESRFSEKNFVR